MKYYTNAIGSLFGLFGGRKIIAVPDIDDIAGMPEIRIRILESIVRSDDLMQKILKDPREKEAATHSRIKAEKIIEYQKRMLKANGYYTGTPDFAEMDKINDEIAEDWWLKNN